jgi:DNA adenine methylase
MNEYICDICDEHFNSKMELKNHKHNNVLNDIINTKLIDKFDKFNKFDNIHIPKPIIKWIGGKTQIIDKLMVKFPKKINNYHEIFLGGGSVLFSFLSYVKNEKIKLYGNVYAYDINEPLIFVYKNIQNNYIELYNKLTKIINKSNKCSNENDENYEIIRKPENINQGLTSKESFYYYTRNKYNKLSDYGKISILGSALFIYLNKTCFRGMHRTGPNGFNVPYGNYNNPEIINLEHLKEINELIQNVTFCVSDFTDSLKYIKKNDFIYMDPPYAPENDNSFVGYNENGFNINEHNKLFKMCHKLTDKRKKFMMSNSDVKLIRDNFNNNYIIDSILCKRSINAKNPESKTKEVIIMNYINE